MLRKNIASIKQTYVRDLDLLKYNIFDIILRIKKF